MFVASSGYRFCIRLSDIERLLPLAQLQAVPDAPDYLVGLMNLGGDPLPVVGLAARLGLERDWRCRMDSPILLLNAGGHRMGLLVDDVRGVRQVPRNAVRGEGLFRDGLPPVLGAVMQDDGIALILDTLRVADIDLSGLAEPLALDEEMLALCRESQDE